MVKFLTVRTQFTIYYVRYAEIFFRSDWLTLTLVPPLARADINPCLARANINPCPPPLAMPLVVGVEV